MACGDAQTARVLQTGGYAADGWGHARFLLRRGWKILGKGKGSGI